MKMIFQLFAVCLLVGVTPSSSFSDEIAEQTKDGFTQTQNYASAKTGLLVLGCVTSLSLIVAATIGIAAIWSSNLQKVLTDVIQGGLVLKMGTIFGIVTTVGILALCGRLSTGVIAFLSGLAGYILGGIQREHDRGVPPGNGK